MATYYESGTGRTITNPAQADPSKFYIEAGTGKQIAGSALRGTSSSPAPSNPNAGRTQVTLGNGQVVWYDAAGRAYDASGNTVSNMTIAAAKPAVASTTPAQSPNQQTDTAFEKWLNGLAVSDDQKQAIRAVYGAVSTNDEAKAKQITEAMAAAREFSDPFFKAQTRLVTDALTRGLAAREGDLAFNVDQKNRTLQALRDDIAASRDFLSFQNRQELEALRQKYEQDVDTTRDDMAATGFTTSSRRSKAEKLLSDNYGSAVESSNRQLAYQTSALDRRLASNEASTAAEVARLRQLASEGKIADLRTAEEKVGSPAISGLGYTDILGGVGGSIPRQQLTDANSFASAFVF